MFIAIIDFHACGLRYESLNFANNLSSCLDTRQTRFDMLESLMAATMECMAKL